MPRTVMVATAKGGVGKTTVSIVGVDASRARGWAPRVIDIDIAADGGPETSLCTVFNEAHRVRIAPRVEEVVDDPLKVHSHWDPIYEFMRGGDNWMDFGANVIEPVLGWAANVDLGRRVGKAGINVDFVAVTTSNIEAIQKASHALKRFGEIFAAAGPLARRFLVLSYAEGGYERVENVPELQAMVGSADITLVRFEKAVTEIWSPAEKRRLSPARVLAMSEDEVVEEFELGELEASRGKKLYQVWYEKCAMNMQEAGLLPVPDNGSLFTKGAANQPVAAEDAGIDIGAFQQGGKGGAGGKAAAAE